MLTLSSERPVGGASALLLVGGASALLPSVKGVSPKWAWFSVLHLCAAVTLEVYFNWSHFQRQRAGASDQLAAVPAPWRRPVLAWRQC